VIRIKQITKNMISFSKIASAIGRGLFYGVVFGTCYPIVTAYNGYMVFWSRKYFVVWAGMGFVVGIIGSDLGEILSEMFPPHSPEWREARDRAHKETIQRNNDIMWKNIRNYNRFLKLY